jgi:hypothetical protein
MSKKEDNQNASFGADLGLKITADDWFSQQPLFAQCVTCGYKSSIKGNWAVLDSNQLAFSIESGRFFATSVIFEKVSVFGFRI